VSSGDVGGSVVDGEERSFFRGGMIDMTRGRSLRLFLWRQFGFEHTILSSMVLSTGIVEGSRVERGQRLTESLFVWQGQVQDSLMNIHYITLFDDTLGGGRCWAEAATIRHTDGEL
jgi:hypothetical protein